MPSTPRPLVFLDTETDGLHRRRQPWEIAMIRRDLDGTETETCFQVAGLDRRDADPAALRIGRFFDRYQEDEQQPAAAAAAAVEQVTSGATLVGANPAFDAETLARFLRRHGCAAAWHYRLMDVEALVAGHLHRDVGGLTACAAALGVMVDPAAEHTALGDARTVRAVWDAVMLSGAAPPAAAQQEHPRLTYRPATMQPARGITSRPATEQPIRGAQPLAFGG